MAIWAKMSCTYGRIRAEGRTSWETSWFMITIKKLLHKWSTGHHNQRQIETVWGLILFVSSCMVFLSSTHTVNFPMMSQRCCVEFWHFPETSITHTVLHEVIVVYMNKPHLTFNRQLAITLHMHSKTCWLRNTKSTQHLSIHSNHSIVSLMHLVYTNVHSTLQPYDSVEEQAWFHFNPLLKSAANRQHARHKFFF